MTGTTYALAQLAHLAEVDSMDFDGLLWASTVRASEGIHHFRKSSYDVWGEDEEPDPEELSKVSLRTQCYLALPNQVLIPTD
ncbi:hypothetical protein [Halorubrum sp. GN11GM_10-3_MGM]|uniref:hypothetical protein n=1 Tax=Halorubrum sp. GN11GM_10-3_MGM TaxID=2518111 RepID=UPI0010F6A34E|nr:hypothetical protein [Halorubrum sp. GN11GM_10-3_MGM]